MNIKQCIIKVTLADGAVTSGFFTLDIDDKDTLAWTANSIKDVNKAVLVQVFLLNELLYSVGSVTPSLFAIRQKSTGKLVHFDYQSMGDDSEGVSVTFELNSFGDHFFVKSTREELERVLKEAKTVQWYNADLTTPMISRGLDIDDLEIVEFTMK